MSTVLSWSERVEAASKVMGITTEKLEQILNHPDYQIMSMDEADRIELMENEEALPFGDLRKLFVEDNKVPLPKLRMAIKYFRRPATKSESVTLLQKVQDEFGVAFKPQIKDLPLASLLKYYNPKSTEIPQINEALCKLEEKYGPFIAFKPGTEELAIPEIIGYVEDILAGFPKQTYLDIKGIPTNLYRVGEVPNAFLEEDPMFPGTPLRRGRSTKNQIDWTEISHENRCLFRIFATKGVVFPQDKFTLQKFVETHIDDLASKYPNEYLFFVSQKALNVLPSLKIAPNSVSEKKQNPWMSN